MKVNLNYKNYGRFVENFGIFYIKKLVIKIILEIEVCLVGINFGKIYLIEFLIVEIFNLK